MRITNSLLHVYKLNSYLKIGAITRQNDTKSFSSDKYLHATSTPRSNKRGNLTSKYDMNPKKEMCKLKE
jgi:hypothetical protein